MGGRECRGGGAQLGEGSPLEEPSLVVGRAAEPRRNTQASYLNCPFLDCLCEDSYQPDQPLPHGKHKQKFGWQWTCGPPTLSSKMTVPVSAGSTCPGPEQADGAASLEAAERSRSKLVGRRRFLSLYSFNPEPPTSFPGTNSIHKE